MDYSFITASRSMSSPPPSPPPKSPRSRPKHSRKKNKIKNHKNNSAVRNNNNEMAISEPSSPSSPFSWRLEKRKPSSASKKKSHGIAPVQFHSKQEYNTVIETDDGESSSSALTPRQQKPASLPAWKENIERNLLIQQQKAYTGDLEAKRKQFRKTTQLKTWPLQDMA